MHNSEEGREGKEQIRERRAKKEEWREKKNK